MCVLQVLLSPKMLHRVQMPQVSALGGAPTSVRAEGGACVGRDVRHLTWCSGSVSGAAVVCALVLAPRLLSTISQAATNFGGSLAKR